jgi:hypothetical protein
MKNQTGKSFFLIMMVFIMASCLITPSKQIKEQPKAENNSELSTSSYVTDEVQNSTSNDLSSSAPFKVGINFCNYDTTQISGWKSYECAFWIESNVYQSQTLADFLNFENENNKYSIKPDLNQLDPSDQGVYVTTDGGVKYPVDFHIESDDSTLSNNVILKGVPIKYTYISILGNGIKDTLLFFAIPEAMSPIDITFPYDKQTVKVPAQGDVLDMPPINRDILSTLPQTIHSDYQVSITPQVPSLSVHDYITIGSLKVSGLQFNMNVSITSLDKTSQQVGSAFFPFILYDPNGYYWLDRSSIIPGLSPETYGITWNLAPGQSGISSQTFSEATLYLPHSLYLIPVDVDSNVAYKIDIKSIKVLNCNPPGTDEEFLQNGMNQHDISTRLPVTGELNGIGTYQLGDIINGNNYIWKLTLPSDDSYSLTFTGNNPNETDWVYQYFFLPDGKEILPQISTDQVTGDRVIWIYSICDNSYYLLLQSVTDMKNISLTISK